MPTLIKAYPKPEKRIVGDLSNKERLLISPGFRGSKAKAVNGNKQGGENGKQNKKKRSGKNSYWHQGS
jgi:hypothetical protein